MDEVITSQQVRLERHGAASEQPNDARLADIYRRQLQAVRDWLDAQPNFSVLSVDYHEVLSAPEQVVGHLNRFLDGRSKTDAMLQVPDWSLYRQRGIAQAAAGSGTVE